MAGKKSQLTILATRKELLLLESQLNRALFVESVQVWKHEFSRSKQQLTSLGSMASWVGRIATVVPAIRRLFGGGGGAPKKTGLRSILGGTLTGTSLWYLLRWLRRKT
jgi:hypothetical protein